MSSTYAIKNINSKINLEFNLPGSKSITNRAFLIAMLSNGKTDLKGVLESDDSNYMSQALLDLGINLKKKNKHYTIQGNSGIFKTKNTLKLFLGNAGTAVRFLTATMSLRNGKTIITGIPRMQARPIQDLIQGLRTLGVKIKSLKQKGYPPIEITGKSLEGGEVSISGTVSSQYFSAILLTAPYAKKPIKLKVKGTLCSKPYIDITLDLMQQFGIKVKNNNYQSFQIPQGVYQSQSYTIEGDASSASYFWALTALHGGRVKINNLTFSSKQGDIHFLEIITKMLNSKFKIIKNKHNLEFIVEKKAKLKALGKIDMNQMPDVAMTLAMLAACAEGETIITNIANLRVKETDRIKAIVKELHKIGIQAEELKNGIKIIGNPKLQSLPKKIKIETYADHRMAMCFAVLGTRIDGIIINDPSCTSKTYPRFWKDLERLF